MHEDLSTEELRRLIADFAKSRPAHDGCWFLAVEKAVRQDERSRYRFAPRPVG